MCLTKSRDVTQSFMIHIQNLPQFTARVLINSVVMDTVCIGIEVSKPISGGYTIYGKILKGKTLTMKLIIDLSNSSKFSPVKHLRHTGGMSLIIMS